ncbi:hypothetical protein CTT30_12540 [Vibrio coralliilyticus]|nr:hypothetical protein CTT30_12540 [Vibrio coralliilyticus]
MDDARRIELLRYRVALLHIRLEKYIVGCSRWKFASERMANTKANIELLKVRVKNGQTEANHDKRHLDDCKSDSVADSSHCRTYSHKSRGWLNLDEWFENNIAITLIVSCTISGFLGYHFS